MREMKAKFTSSSISRLYFFSLQGTFYPDAPFLYFVGDTECTNKGIGYVVLALDCFKILTLL